MTVGAKADKYPPLVPGVSRFDRLLVVALSKDFVRKNTSRYDCLCDCGAWKECKSSHLRNGLVKSCGCLNREVSAARKLIHGRSHTRIHNNWTGMIMRCTNPDAPKYPDYGGRGIKVCERWLNSFVAFLEDMGEPPTSGHSIDRIDNDGNYEPGNTKWSTRVEQGRNKRNNRLLTCGGETMPLSAWAEKFGVKPDTISMRLFRGWPDEEAIHGRRNS